MALETMHVVKILHAIETGVDINESGAPVVLTIGQALLVVIKACETTHIEAPIIKALKILYLEGVKSKDDQLIINIISNYLADNKKFTTSADPTLVSEDPTRRYFETHLAYHILQSQAQLFDLEQLKAFKQHLQDILLEMAGHIPLLQAGTTLILEGEYDPSFNHNQMEYAELIYKLKSHRFYQLSPRACDNLCEIAKSTFLALLNAQKIMNIPGNIYTDTFFKSEGVEHRARKVKVENNLILSQSKGLMLTTTPIPYDDLAKDTTNSQTPCYQNKANEQSRNHDLSMTQTTQDTTTHHREDLHYNCGEQRPKLIYPRPAEISTFMPEGTWNQYLFKRQTQVYSNGISSTTLATLRNLLMQKRQGNPFFQENFRDYFTTYASLMLFHSGGHSFFEFFEVLKAERFHEFFEATNCTELIARDELMQQWLFKDQQEAFDTAMRETLEYMQPLINRRIVHAQLQKTIQAQQPPDDEVSCFNSQIKSPIAMQMNAIQRRANRLKLHQAVLKEEVNVCKEILQQLRHFEDFSWVINGLNSYNYTPIMVAVQLGKLEHVKLFAEYKETSFHPEQKNTLTLLTLAIISGNPLVVSYLLTLPQISLFRRCLGTEQNLKARTPALYFACIHNNLSILNMLLDRNEFQFSDLIDAMKITLQVENMNGFIALRKALMDRDPNNGPLLYSLEAESLLSMAAQRGNIELLSIVLQNPTQQTLACIDFATPLRPASLFNYIATTQWLLNKALLFNKLPPNDFLNLFMLTALDKSHFKMAVIFMAYGANLNQLNYNFPHLDAFQEFLNKTPSNDWKTLFLERDAEIKLSALVTLPSQQETFSQINRTIDLLQAFKTVNSSMKALVEDHKQQLFSESIKQILQIKIQTLIAIPQLQQTIGNQDIIHLLQNIKAIIKRACRDALFKTESICKSSSQITRGEFKETTLSFLETEQDLPNLEEVLKNINDLFLTNEQIEIQVEIIKQAIKNTNYTEETNQAMLEAMQPLADIPIHQRNDSSAVTLIFGNLLELAKLAYKKKLSELEGLASHPLLKEKISTRSRVLSNAIDNVNNFKEVTDLHQNLETQISNLKNQNPQTANPCHYRYFQSPPQNNQKSQTEETDVCRSKLLS